MIGQLCRNNYLQRRQRESSRQGTIIVLLAVALVIVLVGVVFSIDVAFVHVAQTEIKAVSDLSAMAAVEALTRTQDPSAAIVAAQTVASAHTVAGQTFHLDTADIVLGRHHFGTSGKIEFQQGVQPYTAVRVFGRLESGSANSPVQSFFGGLFGVDEFETSRVSTASQLDRDIVLVLDISTSMNSDDRFEAMVDAANAFVDEIEVTYETERVMIVSYNHSATTNQVLTESPLEMRTAINALEITDSGTAIGEGLLQATDDLDTDPLKRPLAQQVIILMTDGQHNTGVEPDDVVDDAVARHHIVNTITFSNSADQGAMQSVAATGGGIHIHADDKTELIQAFRDMARSLELQLTD